MAIPLKIQIRKALENQLKLVDGNGAYHHKFTVIENGEVQNYDNYGANSFPLCYVVDSDEAEYNFLGSDNSFTTGKDSQDLDGWLLAVQVVIKRSDESENLRDKMDELEYDAIYAVAQNSDMGGLVDYIYPKYRDRQQNYGDKYGWVTIVFSVKYDFRPLSGLI